MEGNYNNSGSEDDGIAKQAVKTLRIITIMVVVKMMA